jgi:uncharacterized membrane protein
MLSNNNRSVTDKECYSAQKKNNKQQIWNIILTTGATIPFILTLLFCVFSRRMSRIIKVLME